MLKILISLALASSLIACGGSSSSSDTGNPSIDSKQVLGQKLFSDKNLSFNRSQSCATCHNPDHGFVDDRDADGNTGNQAFAASLGDDGSSLGDRNAPTAAYAAFSPEFSYSTRERVESQRTSGIGAYEGFLGGQFWDGREDDLAGQAGGPPTNPIEMGMPNKASVVERLQENSAYIEAFEALFGADIFDDVDAAYAAMAESIGEFELKDAAEFYPFDSKYDRSLSGEYTYSPSSPAAHGKTLFFSSDLTCAACHQLRPLNDRGEIFTSFEYHNIGVPENTTLRALNGSADNFVDEGLLANPAVTATTEKGKFKVPTLRNVAVTAPYMHNGIFQELETVIHFYQHAKDRGLNRDDAAGNINNPETDLPWAAPEVADNIEHELLRKNQINLGGTEVQALVCFFMSLTDAKYEHLLDSQKVTRCGL